MLALLTNNINEYSHLFTYLTQDPGERQLQWVGARRPLHGLHQLPGRDVAPGHSGKLLSSIFILALTQTIKMQ